MAGFVSAKWAWFPPGRAMEAAGHRPSTPAAMAGIWEEYADKFTGELIRTFAIATCEPNELMATIHDRLPVILAPEDYMR
ncbi:SOS response-associated peptidase family protein [Mesorhizobium sp. M0047]|uniref:SOS response-associated peptidase family protein n=1 Tax=Mesorhizobium sp. M0047 TaxID=2956859 RepID=UPI00333D44FD